MNKFRWTVWIAMLIGLLFCFFGLKDLFAIGQITRRCGMVLIVFATATEPLLRYISILTRNIEKWYTRRKEKRRERMAGRKKKR